ncbi:IS110 family transposase [Aldersonia kunmingensis]|uniref:IS110 family transposase n=1 Tax=Aldersonia kunmingensis TaxID=408066 RepID=UPI003CCBA374
MSGLWAGIDAGKRAHHCVVLNAAGTAVFSQRSDNDESALLDRAITFLEARFRCSGSLDFRVLLKLRAGLLSPLPITICFRA